MNRKILGILVMTLLIGTALPVLGSINKVERSMSVGDNLAPNPSFEEGDVLPTGWEHTDFENGEIYHWDSDYAYDGEKSIGIQVPFVQQWQPFYTWYTTELIPVDLENNYYVFSFYYKYTEVPDIAHEQVLLPQVYLYDENEDYINFYLVSVCQYNPLFDWCFGAVYSESSSGDFVEEDVAYAQLKIWHKPQFDWSSDNQIRIDDVFFGTIEKNTPPEKPTINGPTSGNPGVEYTYTAISTDADGDQVYYIWDWGDGNESWSTRRDSGVSASESHIWENEGTYEIKVQTLDFRDLYSDWTTLEVSMPKNKAINTPFLQFLENHPHLFPLLRQLLNLQ